MKKSEKRVYILTGVLTIVLYVMGVLTGFYVYSLGVTQGYEELSDMRSEIDRYSKGLQSLQLQQLYLTSDINLSCRYLVSSLNSLQADIYSLAQKLPDKLEVFEKYYPQDQEYVMLKNDYMNLLLKSWMFSLSVRNRCGKNVVPVLYFYSSDCDDCIEQGYVLDALREDVDNMYVFTIDFNLDDETVSTIKQVYSVGEVPALIVNENVLPGFHDYDEVLAAIRNGGSE
jgi:hypothetical protein